MINFSGNKIFRFRETAYLVLIILFFTGNVFALKEKGLKEGAVTVDGLTVVESTRFTEKQIKKNVDWSDYTKYQIAPVEVSFRKDWQKDYNREQDNLSRQVTDEDMTEIRKTMMGLVYQEFDRALKDRAGLKKAEMADSKTLLFEPRIINLDIYNPDVSSSAPVISQTYARQFLEATLLLEVYDAVSGEILARWVDTREDPDRGYYDWVNRITNKERARTVVRGWTGRMVKGLEELKKAD